MARELRNRGPARDLFRKAQRFVVTIPDRQLAPLLSAGSVTALEWCPDLYIQTDDLLYDPKIGLRVDQPEYQPDALVL